MRAEKGAKLKAKGKKQGQRPLKVEKDEASQTEKGLDFGGIPDRSLKKNLGC
jgi:hypothetical protein